MLFLVTGDAAHKHPLRHWWRPHMYPMRKTFLYAYILSIRFIDVNWLVTGADLQKYTAMETAFAQISNIQSRINWSHKWSVGTGIEATLVTAPL